MFLAFGVVCALLEAQRSGEGQVVDAAMVDGAATLMTMFWAMLADRGVRRGRARGRTCSTPAPTSTTCTSAPTGSTSRSARSSRSSTPSCCGSPGWPATRSSPAQMDKSRWPALKARLAEVFATKTRDEWCALMEHTDVCFAPVLTMSEAADAPAQRRPLDDRRGRRHSASRRRRRGSAARRPRSTARRRTPGSTPARCSPTGASPRTASTSWSSPAPSPPPSSRPTSGRTARVRSGRGRSLRRRWRRSSSSTPTPTTRPARPAARWPGLRPRATGSCSWCAPNGDHGESPGRPAPRRDAGRPAAPGGRASAERARGRPGRLARVRRLGDDRVGAERRPGVVLAGRRRRGRPSGWPTILRERAGRRRRRCTTGTAATATPTTSRSTGSATVPPTWPARRGASRSTFNRDA